MLTVKKIGLLLAIPLLSISVLIGVSLWSLQQYFGDSSHIKSWLVESKLYPAIHSEIVAQSVKSSQETTESEGLTLSSPVIKKALEQALTADYIQSASEEVLDGTYAWLDGSTPKPTYTIDVDPLKKAFATSIVGSAQKRLSKLPDCILPDQATTTDPFSVNCKPPATISQAELKRLRREIEKNNDFLPQDITADTQHLGPTIEGQKPAATQPWYESVTYLPTFFQWIQRGPVIALVVGLLSLTGVVFLNSNRRQGLRRAAITLLSSSVILTLSSLALLFSTRFINPPVTDESSQLYDPLLLFIKLATSAVNRWQLITCGVLIATGVIVLIVLRATRPAVTAPLQKK